jgi:hypothetical protein
MIERGYTPPIELARVRNIALIAGVVFFVLLLLGLFSNRDQFFRSYLVGFIFWMGITTGSLALLCLQHMTGGAWGLVIRRVLEASTRVLPLMLILFLPVSFGLKYIYSWTDPNVMNSNPALQEKAAHYLKPSLFILRAAIYFGIWMIFAWFLNRWSLEQDRAPEERWRKRMQMLSGPGLVLFVLTTTFAAIDWAMSLDPTWSSTIFGFIFVAAWAMSALAFTILMCAWLAQREPMNRVLQPSHFHDLGNLLLTLVMLWTYFTFSQYLIIWSGNLPEETSWYVARKHGGWGAVALAIAILQFAFPFLMLLSRALKKSAQKLAMLAGLILVMRVVDVIWLVEPTFSPRDFGLSWMDIVAPLAIGGLWLGVFTWQLQQRPLMPLNDPQLESALEPVRIEKKAEVA